MADNETSLIKQIEIIKELTEKNLENDKRYLDAISQKVDQNTDRLKNLDKISQDVHQTTDKITQLLTAVAASGEVLVYIKKIFISYALLLLLKPITFVVLRIEVNCIWHEYV